MRQITITVYNIDELSEKAREKAYYDWLDQTDYHFAEDNRKTLKAFEQIFPVKVTNWQYDAYSYHFNFDFTCDEIIENLSGIRLLKYLYNNYYDDLFKGKYYSTPIKYKNSKPSYKYRHSKVLKDNSCVLTGYYLDDIILKPIYSFMKKPDNNTTFYELMRSCLNEWGKACSEDVAYCTSIEYFMEYARANGLEFDEQGNMI